MTTLTRRGAVFHFDTTVAGRRLRGSLGTNDKSIAEKRRTQLDYAIQAGPESEAWAPLRLVLPVGTVQTLNRAMVGPAPSFTLTEVERKFVANLERRVALGRMSQRTLNVYELAARRFFDWLAEQEVREMDKVGAETLEKYQLDRMVQIQASPQATNGRSILCDVTAIKSLLEFCVEENWMKPFKFQEMAKIEAEVEGAEPFTALELGQMAQRAEGIVRLVYLIFRWTGMRCSDVSALVWSDIDFASKRIVKLTQKRKKQIVVPLAPELLTELTAWKSQLQPESKDSVLPNMTRTRLYTMITSLGKKSGVFGCHPHRFRATFVCYLLEKGRTVFEVAKMIGDDPATLGRAYAKFTDTMIDEVREVFENEGKTA